MNYFKGFTIKSIRHAIKLLDIGSYLIGVYPDRIPVIVRSKDDIIPLVKNNELIGSIFEGYIKGGE